LNHAAFRKGERTPWKPPLDKRPGRRPNGAARVDSSPATISAAALAAPLLAWYRRHRRRLPWREQPDPYRVWLSEVMLQQTRVETVIPYYERFLERFPTIERLARAREEEVLALWSGLGYYRRARALLEGARRVVREHGGRFPSSLEEALALPGVGPYTAAAVLSIAYNLPLAVLDGNVERVVTRLLRQRGNPRRAAAARRLREAIAGWMPQGEAANFNQALMELGALICAPAAPACPRCPLREVCAACRESDAHRFPELPRPRKTEAVELEVGILGDGGRYLLERSSGLSYLEGLWVFPLAAAGTEGTGARGIAGRLSEELGTAVRVTGELEPLRHAITYRRMTLRPKLLAAAGGGALELRGKRGFRWARLQELGRKLPVSSICLKLARRLRAAT
jgi:A/G-specific adenine glycosylase